MTATFRGTGIITDDLARSLAFYRLLGLQFPDDAEKQPHVEYALPGGMALMWDPVETIHSFEPDWSPGTGNPRFALAFVCASPAEVDEIYARIVGAGHHGHKEPWDAFWGQRYAIVHDPDSNPVDLCAAL